MKGGDYIMQRIKLMKKDTAPLFMRDAFYWLNCNKPNGGQMKIY